MSAPDPQEAWRRLQNELTRRSARFGGAGGGAPKGLGGGVVALALLGGGIFVANNALFNGTHISQMALQNSVLAKWLKA
jgi:prohibitin 2